MLQCCKNYVVCKKLGTCIGNNIKSYNENISRKVFNIMSTTKPSKKTIVNNIPKN